MAIGNYSYGTNAAAGTFSIQSDGYIQGMAQDDPATRFSLSQGVLGPNEVFPMWGGVAIMENIPAASANDSLGGLIQRATSAANTTGFAVFDQNFASVSTPSSPVPLVGSGGGVTFYRNGSGARIAVAIEPEFATALQGGLINQQATWDLNTQRIAEYQASSGNISITSITPTYVPAANGVPGYWNMVVVTAANSTGVPTSIGDVVNISGATNTGGGGAAAVNGNFMVTSYTSTTSWSFQIPSSSSTYIQSGALGGTMLLNYSGGLLAAKILRVNVGNSKVVSYNPVTGNAIWVPGQSCALIQI
jgi:hypothetical protein